MFDVIDASLATQLGEKIDRLSKSFAAGYQGIQNAGRTGVGALAVDQLDDVMRSITLEESDFFLTKDIPTLKATQSVYMYRVKTAVASAGVDLAGFEAYLPQEDASQYIRVAEVLKVYGIRKSITHMAQLINQSGGYAADLEAENDTNAALAMAQALERDLYQGGDLFIDQLGEIDPLVASNPNVPHRNIRGIQANIREGDQSQRGIPGDFVGYGNSRSVIFDRKGGVLERKFVDSVVTAVRDNRGALREAHCTTSQASEFRATFFPIERADISALYAIRGPDVQNDEKVGFSIDTVGGPLQFVPTVFKYGRQKALPIGGSVGSRPATPSVTSTAAGASVIGSGSGFQEGETYSYRVQAVNVSGANTASAAVTKTVAAGEDNKPIELTISGGAGAEYFMVFRSPVETSGRAGTEMFIGKMLPGTKFVDNGKLVPGLDSVLFMPRDKQRVQLAVLGNLLHKIALGLRGLASEHVYASYVGCVVDKPRTLALADNVYQSREDV